MDLKNLSSIDSERAMPLMRLPLRTVVIQLENGRILFCPASTLTPDQLKSAGEITAVVAPNLLHLEGMPNAARAFPRAQLWGPPGAREKRPEVRWTGLLGLDPWPYEKELQRVSLEGIPRLNENVFLHRASRTLLVGDLVFNIQNPKGLGAWLILNVFGTYRRLAVSRLFLRMSKDPSALGATLTRVAELEFDNLLPAHGAPVLDDAKPRFLAALRERGLAP